MADQDLIDIALFPIPDMVAFPGATVPLHVFEPRYRRMIQESIDQHRMIGVCHTRKTISNAPRQQSMEEALSSNQATYQPQQIFSAGYCEVQDVLEDGRLLVLIKMNGRFRMVAEQQSLPYRIVSCEPLQDEQIGEAADEAEALQRSIITRMLELTKDEVNATAKADLEARWRAAQPAEFSFLFFEFVRFDADLMQMLLENTNPMSRLRLIAEVLQAA